MKIVRVTRKHLRRGTPGSPHSCPVALALNEQYPFETSAETPWTVGLTVITKHLDRVSRRRYRVSERVTRRINTIDQIGRGCEVNPFWFVIREGGK